MNKENMLIKTPEDAIETIKSNMPSSGYQMLRESLDMAIEALEKQIPKKPEVSCSVVSAKYYRCPTCKRIVGLKIPYCRMCGQAISWN